MNQDLSRITLDSVAVKLEGSATESGKFRTISSYEELHPELTDAGLAFLNLCDGKRTLRDTAELLKEQFAIEEDGRGEKAVIAFCHFLERKNLVRLI